MIIKKGCVRMEIEKTIAINSDTAIETSDDFSSEENSRQPVPVTRANAIVYILLERIYSNNDETTQDDRLELQKFIHDFSQQDYFDGSADEFHNFSVELARWGEYCLACDVLDVALNKKKGGFCKNCDLLADYLQYGVNCGRVKEAKKHFKTLMGISRRRWTWRGFSFVVHFLQTLDELDEFDNSIKQMLTTIDCSGVTYPDIELHEKVMLALVQEFKKYQPSSEEPYQIESQVYLYLKDEAKTLAILKEAETAIVVTPKCSLRRADLLYDRGNYVEANEAIHKALIDSDQTHSNVNIGYLHYLLAKCIIQSTAQQGNTLSEKDIDEVFNHFNKALDNFADDKTNDHQQRKQVIRRNVKDILSDYEGVEVPERYQLLFELLED